MGKKTILKQKMATHKATSDYYAKRKLNSDYNRPAHIRNKALAEKHQNKYHATKLKLKAHIAKKRLTKESDLGQ